MQLKNSKSNVSDDRYRMPTGYRSASAIIIAVAVLLAAAAVASLHRQAVQEQSSIEAVAQERGKTLLQSLAAGLRAQGRLGLYRVDRLQVVLEELAQTPDIIAVSLADADGHIIVEVNTATQGSSELTVSDRFLLPTVPGRGTRQRGGPGAPLIGPQERGEFALTVVLDATDMKVEIQQAWRRFWVQALSATLVLALCAGLALMLLRHRRLSAALLLERERSRQLERLAQVGAGLAHETKNPLSVIRGMALTIAEGSEAAPPLQRLAYRIVDESDRTVGQVNAFLELSRPVTPELAPVGLHALLSGLTEVVSAEAEQAGVTLCIKGPDAVVWADASLLRRALLNLMINALRAAPRAQIVLRVSGQGGQVTVSVSDDGVGIAPDDLARVADPYFSRFEGGTGLGLAMVEEIARAHGWRLEIESEAGAGTRVNLSGLRTVE